MTEPKYPRNKSSIIRSGIDPQMKRLNKLHAIRANAERKHRRALESVEKYWDDVYAAIDANEAQETA